MVLLKGTCRLNKNKKKLSQFCKVACFMNKIYFLITHFAFVYYLKCLNFAKLEKLNVYKCKYCL